MMALLHKAMDSIGRALSARGINPNQMTWNFSGVAEELCVTFKAGLTANEAKEIGYDLNANILCDTSGDKGSCVKFASKMTQTDDKKSSGVVSAMTQTANLDHVLREMIEETTNLPPEVVSDYMKAMQYASMMESSKGALARHFWLHSQLANQDPISHSFDTNTAATTPSNNRNISSQSIPVTVKRSIPAVSTSAKRKLNEENRMETMATSAKRGKYHNVNVSLARNVNVSGTCPPVASSAPGRGNVSGTCPPVASSAPGRGNVSGTCPPVSASAPGRRTATPVMTTNNMTKPSIPDRLSTHSVTPRDNSGVLKQLYYPPPPKPRTEFANAVQLCNILSALGYKWGKLIQYLPPLPMTRKQFQGNCMLEFYAVANNKLEGKYEVIKPGKNQQPLASILGVLKSKMMNKNLHVANTKTGTYSVKKARLIAVTRIGGVHYYIDLAHRVPDIVANYGQERPFKLTMLVRNGDVVHKNGWMS